MANKPEQKPLDTLFSLSTAVTVSNNIGRSDIFLMDRSNRWFFENYYGSGGFITKSLEKFLVNPYWVLSLDTGDVKRIAIKDFNINTKSGGKFKFPNADRYIPVENSVRFGLVSYIPKGENAGSFVLAKSDDAGLNHLKLFNIAELLVDALSVSGISLEVDLVADLINQALFYYKMGGNLPQKYIDTAGRFYTEPDGEVEELTIHYPGKPKHTVKDDSLWGIWFGTDEEDLDREVKITDPQEGEKVASTKICIDIESLFNDLIPCIYHITNETLRQVLEMRHYILGRLIYIKSTIDSNNQQYARVDSDGIFTKGEGAAAGKNRGITTKWKSPIFTENSKGNMSNMYQFTLKNDGYYPDAKSYVNAFDRTFSSYRDYLNYTDVDNVYIAYFKEQVAYIYGRFLTLGFNKFKSALVLNTGEGETDLGLKEISVLINSSLQGADSKELSSYLTKLEKGYSLIGNEEKHFVTPGAADGVRTGESLVLALDKPLYIFTHSDPLKRGTAIETNFQDKIFDFLAKHSIASIPKCVLDDNSSSLFDKMFSEENDAKLEQMYIKRREDVEGVSLQNPISNRGHGIDYQNYSNVDTKIYNNLIPGVSYNEIFGAADATVYTRKMDTELSDMFLADCLPIKRTTDFYKKMIGTPIAEFHKVMRSLEYIMYLRQSGADVKEEINRILCEGEFSTNVGFLSEYLKENPDAFIKTGYLEALKYTLDSMRTNTEWRNFKTNNILEDILRTSAEYIETRIRYLESKTEEAYNPNNRFSDWGVAIDILANEFEPKEIEVEDENGNKTTEIEYLRVEKEDGSKVFIPPSTQQALKDRIVMSAKKQFNKAEWDTMNKKERKDYAKELFNNVVQRDLTGRVKQASRLWRDLLERFGIFVG